MATTTTAKPKGPRWQHKELEAVLKSPTVGRVTEAGGLYGVVRHAKDGTPSVLFRWPELQDAWNRLGQHLEWALNGKQSNVVALPTKAA